MGVDGYLNLQLSDDHSAGASVPTNRGSAFAIGPSVRCDSGKGWFVTAKFPDESQFRNLADGRAFWLKAVFPPLP